VGGNAVADDSDLERTEPASQRRLEQAREEGQVPQSRELSTFLVLIAGTGGVWVLGNWFAERIEGVLRHGLTLDRKAVFDPHAMGSRLVDMGSDALVTLLPLLLLLVVAAVAGPFFLGGRVFAPKALSPDLTRLDPLKGFGRMFSLHGLAELVKAIAKSLLIGLVVLWVVRHERDALFALITQPVEVGLANSARMLLFAALTTVAGLALVAALDVPFQLWQYYSKLRMTKEEARQESKEMEGDPQVKARIRSQQREMARRRMMSEVPKADVVVTNPTHFAVALRYDARRDGAPRVVAKGAGLIAQKIREIAAQHSVPVLEAPALARALHRHTDLGDAIPAALYTAVAEVMAWVYQLNAYLKQGGLPPQAPTLIAVPGGLDPGPAA
jgi:flagellar biosynthetic protein FlhB